MAGTPVSGFEFDIDSDERDPATPDIGADEYVPPAVCELPAGRAPRGIRLGRNPAGDRATVSFCLAAGADVRLCVIDAAGRAVAEFDAGRRGAGPHSAELDLRGLAAGVYLVELRAGSRRAAVKLVRR
jgi:hypothetical protein